MFVSHFRTNRLAQGKTQKSRHPYLGVGSFFVPQVLIVGRLRGSALVATAAAPNGYITLYPRNC